MVAGHDSGLAINTKEFLQSRFFAWDPQGFGRDNSTHFGSIILHSWDYLLAKVAGADYAGNQLAFFFWISIIFISAFIFSYSLRDKLGKVFSYLFPVFLTFNFFILQSIFILERAKYSILVDSLLFLTIFLKVRNKKLSVIKGAIITSFVFFIFNSGSWLGLPLYGGFGVILLSLFVYEFLIWIKTKKSLYFKRFLVFILFFTIGFILLNGYSILPYFATFIKQDISFVIGGDLFAQNKGWLESLSQAVSFINVFRLQGVPDWYASSHDVNTAHSYSNEYLTNPIFVTVSLIFPIIAFLSFVLAKRREEKRTLSLFGLITLLGMAFMAGSHEPLGKLYEILFRVVPGFSIFRSPFYKFGSAYFIGISTLLSFSLSVIIGRIRVSSPLVTKFLKVFGVLAAIAFWLWFHKVIFDPQKIFTWQQGFSTRFTPPSYLADFQKLMSQDRFKDTRILLVPSINEGWRNDAYTWGYWSLTNLPSIISGNSFVSNSEISSQQKQWVDGLYYLIKSKQEENVNKTASRLGIGYFLLRKDVLADASWSAAENPQYYEDVLNGFESLEKTEEVGEWVIYKLKEPDAKFTTTSTLVSIPREHLNLTTDLLNRQHTAFSADLDIKPQLSQFVSSSLWVNTCESCNLEIKPRDYLPIVTISPDSFLYFIKIIREKSTLGIATSDEQRMSAYLGFTLRRAAETRRMWDFSARDRFVIQNLRTMNKYLDNIYEILQGSSDPQKDFFTAKQLLVYLGSVEENLSPMVSRLDELSKEKIGVREELLNLLWNIGKIKGFYDPILGNLNRWDTQKVFIINLQSEERQVYMSKLLLPSDEEGNPINPVSVKYESGQEAKLSLTSEDGFISFRLKSEKLGLQSTTLNFPELPNLYRQLKVGRERIPTGIASCITGRVIFPKPGSLYRIFIYFTNTNQKLRLYIKNSGSPDITTFFLRGDDEIDVFPILQSEPFTYLYNPPGGSIDPTFYLCSTTRDYPDIEKLEVHEVFSPTLIFKEEYPIVANAGPEVSFTKINSTKFVVKITEAKKPFILLFNEGFSGFWKARMGTALISEEDHFAIDGYANAWRVDQAGDFELSIEYSLQDLFYKGLAVTFISIGVLGGVLIYLSLRKKNV